MDARALGMPMTIKVSRIQGPKRNAWLLQLLPSCTSLFCGENVELRSAAFFEGAWSGTFDEFEFDNCAEVFGTGAKLTKDGWVLVPPTHTIDAIYALKSRAGAWTASNSLAFLKRFTGFEFVESNRKLVRTFIGIAEGIASSPASTRVSSGTLYVLHHYNVLLGPDGLLIRPKPGAPQFKRFEDYRAYLSMTIHNVFANGSASQRGAAYKSLATISSGYDSPCCAVLASEADCAEAITFTEARGGDDDDGTIIAETLGLRVTRFSRPDSRVADRKFVAEMFSTGTQGEDMVYEPLRGLLAQRIFVTGFHGDKVWDRNAEATKYIKRGDISGASLSEFRLSESFVNLPVPFIGVTRHEEIKGISNSEAMKEFSVRNDYDRPIPRRIVEDAGVDRKLFGQTKKAIVTLAFFEHWLLPESVRSEVMDRIKSLRGLKKIQYLFGSAIFSAERWCLSASYRISLKDGSVRNFLGRLTGRLVFRGRSYTIWEHSDPFNVIAFEWALAVVSEDYDIHKDAV